MRRRDFIKVVGGVAVTWPVATRAQRGERMRRIGVLIGVEDDVEGQARLAAFRKGMLDSGWSEGRDLQMDVRFTAGNADRARIYAAELIKSAPDVILANTSTAVTALKERTTTIPIVFAQVVDPVNSGFVDSLAHPGGNMTGFVSLDFGIGAKMARNSQADCAARNPGGRASRCNDTRRNWHNGRNTGGHIVFQSRVESIGCTRCRHD